MKDHSSADRYFLLFLTIGLICACYALAALFESHFALASVYAAFAVGVPALGQLLFPAPSDEGTAPRVHANTDPEHQATRHMWLAEKQLPAIKEAALEAADAEWQAILHT